MNNTNKILIIILCRAFDTYSNIVVPLACVDIMSWCTGGRGNVIAVFTAIQISVFLGKMLARAVLMMSNNYTGSPYHTYILLTRIKYCLIAAQACLPPHPISIILLLILRLAEGAVSGAGVPGVFPIIYQYNNGAVVWLVQAAFPLSMMFSVIVSRALPWQLRLLPCLLGSIVVSCLSDIRSPAVQKHAAPTVHIHWTMYLHIVCVLSYFNNVVMTAPVLLELMSSSEANAITMISCCYTVAFNMILAAFISLSNISYFYKFIMPLCHGIAMLSGFFLTNSVARAHPLLYCTGVMICYSGIISPIFFYFYCIKDGMKFYYTGASYIESCVIFAIILFIFSYLSIPMSALWIALSMTTFYISSNYYDQWPSALRY